MSVYFEEMAAWQYQEDKKLEHQQRALSDTNRERIEEIIPAEDDEDEEEWQ